MEVFNNAHKRLQPGNLSENRVECQISSVKSGRPRMRLNFGPFIWDGLAQLTRLINFYTIQ